MPPHPSRARPSFFWQGLFILLPVAIMAAIALTALVRDRAAAEREARQRAEELLGQLDNQFEPQMALQLSHLWLGADGARASGVSDGDSLLPQLSFTAQGSLNSPSEQAREASPPGWLLNLSANQLQAWNSLDGLAASTTNSERIDAALKCFLDTAPPEAARANAQFLRLRHELADEPPSNAVAPWLAFASSLKSAPLSQSGVPLSSLAVAKALQCACQSAPTDQLWNGLVREVQSVPGSFTPMLLELAEPLVQERPELRSRIESLRLHWEATQRTWEAADAIRRSGRLQGITTASFWLEFQGNRWFCLLQPAQSRSRTGAGTDTNGLTQVRLCPKSAVELALRQVLQDSHLALPPYLRVSAQLEGEALNPIPPMPPKAPPATTLAQAEGRLTLPLSDSVSPPGGPRYVLRLELADRALLFAAQRRRTWMYGTLVLAAALTAAVGFGAAYRSFHRQLRLSELKSNFVSSVSHELRAPIASVRLMAESLERGKVAEPPRQQEYFRFIGQECRRLSSLIENVLDFSRIEQGRKQYEFEPTDLLELTRRTVQLMDTYAAERGIKLALALPEPQPSTLKPQPALDGKAIQQALINLIDNALKHSPQGEQVTVAVEAPSSKLQAPEKHQALNTKAEPAERPAWVVLSVSDHGPGIPAAEQEKIFERFYRLGSELRRETQGVGIGLSIVKHVVEAHGGRVRVHSTPGQGSRFSIELPVYGTHPNY